MHWNIKTKYHDANRTKFYLVYNFANKLLCHAKKKSLILCKKDTNIYLKKRKAAPVLVAIPPSKGLQKEHLNGLLLIPEYNKSFRRSIFSVKKIGYSQEIKIELLEDLRINGGGLVSISDHFGGYLSTPNCSQELKQIDYECAHIKFGRREAGRWEKFFLIPTNERWISDNLKNYTRSELSSSLIAWQGMNVLTPDNSRLGLKRLAKFPLAAHSLQVDWKKLLRPSNVKAIDKTKDKFSLKIGAQFDYLGRGKHICNGDPADLPALRNYIKRLEQKSTKGPCILATARNEAVYLPDWCAYHFALGFEHIYLYTNDNDDCTKDICNRISEITGRLTLITSKIKDPKTRPQYKAYRHALSIANNVADHSWCAIIDIDEYISIQPNKAGDANIQDLILKLNNKSIVRPDVITLNWVYAGLDRTLNHNGMPVGLPRRIGFAEGIKTHIKSLFRPQVFLAAHCHYPIASKAYIPSVVNSKGEVYTHYHTGKEPSLNPNPCSKHAAIIHFWHKSMVEFIGKLARGRGDDPIGSTGSLNIKRMEEFVKAYQDNRELSHKAYGWLRDSHKAFNERELAQSIIKDRIICDLASEAWHAIELKAAENANMILEQKLPLSLKLTDMLNILKPK